MAVVQEVRPDAARVDGSSRRELLPVLLAVVVALAVWLPDIDDIFGAGSGGFNESMWAMGADAISSDGFVASKIGAIRGDFTYGNHPPLMIIAAWLARSVTSGAHWATRIPAIIASLSALWLLVRLACVMGSEKRNAALGVVVMASTPMFLAYGSMLDTWIVGLPFGVAVLVALASDKPPSRRFVLAAAACSLCSWQGLILVALGLPVAVRRFGVRSTFVVSSVAGAVAALLYDQWAGGSGGLEHGWWLDGHSLGHLRDTFGWALLLIPFALAGRDRLVGGLSIAAPAIYATLFTGHADVHAYWLYWWVIPIALGGSVVVGAVAQRLPTFAVAAVGVVALLAVVDPGPNEAIEDRATDAAGEAIASTDSTQAWMPVVAPLDAPWFEYETGISTVVVDSIEEVPAGFDALVMAPDSNWSCTTSYRWQFNTCRRAP